MTSFITLLLGLALASSGVFSIPPDKDMANRKAEEDDNEVDDAEDTAESPDAIDAIETANARLGRQGGRQFISLQKGGCIYKTVIQHEILHALGFHHEQSRSDRDKFVNILKVATNNLGTPYDYNSIMHYSRYAFSKRPRVLPTIVPKPNSKVTIGEATKMSTNDIRRVNQLYQCCE
ncbi:unnamed protein product [Merluccius merluccius]